MGIELALIKITAYSNISMKKELQSLVLNSYFLIVYKNTVTTK